MATYMYMYACMYHQFIWCTTVHSQISVGTGEKKQVSKSKNTQYQFNWAEYKWKYEYMLILSTFGGC